MSTFGQYLKICCECHLHNNNNNNNNNNLFLIIISGLFAVTSLSVCTVLWTQAVHTDREVTANRPDKIIKNKKEKTCTMIDVAIPADKNVVQ